MFQSAYPCDLIPISGKGRIIRKFFACAGIARWDFYLSAKIVLEADSGTRRASMGYRRMLFQQVGLAIVLCVAASGRKIEQPISVVVQPEAESLGSIRASITNHSLRKISFASCPDPYTVRLTDSSGEIVPYKEQGPSQGFACGRNILYTIEPGKTWATEVAINEKFELRSEE